MSEKTWFMFHSASVDDRSAHVYVETESILDAYDIAENDARVGLERWHYCDCCENWYIEAPPPDAEEIRPGVRFVRSN